MQIFFLYFFPSFICEKYLETVKNRGLFALLTALKFDTVGMTENALLAVAIESEAPYLLENKTLHRQLDNMGFGENSLTLLEDNSPTDFYTVFIHQKIKQKHHF